MRILYLSISYSLQKDSLYNNLVDSLLARGHSVTIVRCSKDNKLEKVNKDYTILNVNTGNPFEKNYIKKGINQILLSHYFKKVIKKNLKNMRYDLILYATPPITLYSAIKYCKKQYNAKTFLMLKDIFPQNAVDLELFSKYSLIYLYFRIKEKKYYQISDNIGCMSKGNIEYILENNHKLNKKKLCIFYNSIRTNNNKSTIFNKNKTIFIFGGNIGKPQNIMFLLEVIKELKDYNKAYFKIIGKGTEANKVKNYQINNKLKNLEYIEYLPVHKYEEEMQTADIGIISLDHRFTIPNIPSKFQSYLRQKKPVLAITDENTDLKQMIIDNDCGWWIEANDVEKIVCKIKSICEDKNIQVQKGENGYKYFIKEFDVEKNVDILENVVRGNKYEFIQK